jgi:hypothetical protein
MSSDKKIESITIPYNKVPDTNILSDLRHAMEVQFRYKFYKDVQFPYLHSLGIRNVLQGFGNEDVGFIGILHLWWVNEDSGIVYDNPKKGPVAIKGIWKSEWLNHPQEAIALAQKIQDKKPYDEEKMMQVQQNYIIQKTEERAQKEAVRLLQERKELERPAEEEVEKEAKKVILWN